jgi:hypothetical protein
LRGTETILVVDDESLLLTMAETILTEYGYQNSDGQQRPEGAGDFVARRCEGGFGDHGSGDAGHERARTGRAHPATRRPPVKILCMSGYVMPVDKQTDMYLQKPFTSEGIWRR